MSEETPLAASIVGTVLDGKYRVESMLGQGGMGAVFRARHIALDRVVALKVLSPEVVADEDMRRRFQREARAVAALRDPHTITLYDYGVTPEGRAYFTMELLDGRPMSALLRDEGALPWRRAAALVVQVCDSLREAHARGILHRDLKPDNLFVGKDAAGNEHVKVLDFGLAKMGGDGEPLTRPGMAFGTPQYLSPEQARGQAMDARSDLYSLAVVLYELVLGERPFASDTPLGFLVSHVTEVPKPLRTRRPDLDVPQALDDFLARALAKLPDDRPPDVDAFAAALKAVLDPVAPPDVPPGPASAAQSAAGGGVSSVLPIGLGIAAFGIALGVGAWLLLRPAAEPQPAPPAAQVPPAAQARDAAAPPAAADRTALEAAWTAAGDPLAPEACRTRDAALVAALSGAKGSAALDAVRDGPASGSAEYWTLVAVARRAEKRPAAEVVDAADRAIALCPGLAAADKTAGAALLLAGDAARALPRLEAALRSAPDYLAARFNLGLALAVAGRNDEALIAFDAVLARDPGWPDAHTARGRALLAAGRFAEARAALEAAVAAKPQDAAAVRFLGHAAARSGDAEAANAAWCRARGLGDVEGARLCR
ncbi:MAG: protein kinase [Deltaproteobacteria bacterium]|nr:protein kinase [Deltaproteobacteria bacterium]